MNECENHYRALLKLYMDHVYKCEGSFFVNDWNRTPDHFSDQQWEQLQKIQSELDEEWEKSKGDDEN